MHIINSVIPNTHVVISDIKLFNQHAAQSKLCWVERVIYKRTYYSLIEMASISVWANIKVNKHDLVAYSPLALRGKEYSAIRAPHADLDKIKQQLNAYFTEYHKQFEIIDLIGK